MIVDRQGGESVWMARYKEEGKAKIREQETKQIKARKVEQNQVKDQVGIIMRAIKSFPVEIKEEDQEEDCEPKVTVRSIQNQRL